MKTDKKKKYIPLNETIFAERAEISSHPILSRRAPSTSRGPIAPGKTGAPDTENPRIYVQRVSKDRFDPRGTLTSMPTLEVRPVSISCLCRNSGTRALPLPSSRVPINMVQGERGNEMESTWNYLWLVHQVWLTCPSRHYQLRRNEPQGP